MTLPESEELTDPPHLSSHKIRLASPDIGAEEVDAAAAALLSGILTNGPRTLAFEQSFAQRHETRQAVAFANGTVALTAIYVALGIGPGDEVIVPSMTFISTATSVVHAGATPVFADIREDTFNLDPFDVSHRITSRTRAIVAVHYAGQPADLAELGDIARAADVDLIEDAAQAHGALYHGRPVGGFGKAAMFSFTPTKNITTGEGGIVTTNDTALADRLKVLRNHGQSRLYVHDLLGYNWRLTEMQAAVGAVQLKKLDTILGRKQLNADYMRRRLSGLDDCQLPVALGDRTHPYTLYTVKVPTDVRNVVLSDLLAAGIEARLYFPPAHQQTIFRAAPSSLPRTERLSRQMLSLPFHSRMTEQELKRVGDEIERALNASKSGARPGP